MHRQIGGASFYFCLSRFCVLCVSVQQNSRRKGHLTHALAPRAFDSICIQSPFAIT